MKTTSAAGSGHRGGAGNAGPFSSGRRPNVPHATRRAPRRLHRCPTGDPAPGSCRRSRTQARAAVPRRPSQLPVEAAVAPRSTLLRREYGAGCRHNPPGVPAGGARKDTAGGGAQGGRDLGLRRAIGSARAHRAEELAVDKKSVQSWGPYRRVGRRGPGSRPRWCRPMSSPPPRTSRGASRSRIAGASFGRGATAIWQCVQLYK